MLKYELAGIDLNIDHLSFQNADWTTTWIKRKARPSFCGYFQKEPYTLAEYLRSYYNFTKDDIHQLWYGNIII